MNDLIQKTTEKIKILEKYLQMKLNERDWHGVMDAAADLRELEMRKRTLEEFTPQLRYGSGLDLP